MRVVRVVWNRIQAAFQRSARMTTFDNVVNCLIAGLCTSISDWETFSYYSLLCITIASKSVSGNCSLKKYTNYLIKRSEQRGRTVSSPVTYFVTYSVLNFITETGCPDENILCLFISFFQRNAGMMP
jgi:hypothetical protein